MGCEAVASKGRFNGRKLFALVCLKKARACGR